MSPWRNLPLRQRRSDAKRGAGMQGASGDIPTMHVGCSGSLTIVAPFQICSRLEPDIQTSWVYDANKVVRKRFRIEELYAWRSDRIDPKK